MVTLVRKLPPGSATARDELGDMADWGHLPENVARLVDLMTYWLHAEYAGWTADPDEVESERKRRRHSGYRPPPRPVIEPVASRPESLQRRLDAVFAGEELAANAPLLVAEQGVLSDEQFDALMGW